MGAKVGYARCSAADQNLARQLAALAEIGCDKVFAEKKSGRNVDRAELEALLAYVRPGDTIVVTELARLSRSVKDLVNLMAEFNERQIEFRSLRESFDTSTPTGRLIFNMFAALGEFILDMIRENAAEGRAAAKARGESGGRPWVNPTKIAWARELVTEKNMTQREAALMTGLGRATLGRYGIGVRPKRPAVASVPLPPDETSSAA